jgi:broad specificity phosphatase PhoE
MELTNAVRILLLRHGQSTWNAEGRWQGWADPPLSPAGREQADRAGAAIATRLATAGGPGVARVVSSDLRRARETAQIVARHLGAGEPEVDSGLRERDVGEFSGLTRAEIEARWPGLLAGPGPHAAPGAEPLEAFTERVLAALRRVTEPWPVLAVTHGGAIRAVERHAGDPDGRPPANLAGRWVTLDGPGPNPALELGEPVDLLTSGATA